MESGYGWPEELPESVFDHVLRVLRGEPEMETLLETIEDTCARRDKNGRPVAGGREN